MKKYQELSEQVLKCIGGVGNIAFVTHCATRLRISCKNWELVEDEGLTSIDGVKGVVRNSEQLQLVIGARVSEAYNDFLEVSGWQQSVNQAEIKKNSEEKAKSKGGFGHWIDKLSNFIAPIMMPMIPAILVGGLMRSFYTVATTFFGIDGQCGTARLMMCIFNAAFTYIPIYVGYNMAQRLKLQPIMGAFVGAMMLTSTYTEGAVTDVFGILVPQVSYGGTIIPIMLAVGFMYYVDNGLKKIIPEVLVFFFKPLLTMVIVAPVTFIVLGPLGGIIGSYLGRFILLLTDKVGFLTIPLLAIAQPYMVMIGAEKVVNPLAQELYASIGYDPVIAPASLISNVCVGGAALAIAFLTKDKNKKGMLGSAGLTAVCGITEPAFYGGLILNPKSLLGTAIGAGVAGVTAGLLGMRNFTRGACYGLLTLPLCLDPDTGSAYYLIVAAVVLVISVVVSFVATIVIIKHDEKKKMRER